MQVAEGYLIAVVKAYLNFIGNLPERVGVSRTNGGVSGDIGNAARMKLVANMLVGTMAAALAESMALAEKIGLDQAELLRVLMMSDVASSLVESKGSGASSCLRAGRQ